MRADRRTVLAGIAGSLLIPTAACAADEPTPLRAALDHAAATEPAAGLIALAGFDATRYGESDRLDLVTARAGMTIDAAIARLLPGPRRGRSAYRVTPTTGAWKASTPDAGAIGVDTAALLADGALGIVPPRDTLDRTLAALEGARAQAVPPVADALARQIAALIRLTPKAPARAGLGRLPQGRAWYGLLLKRSLGDDATPAAAKRRLTAELRHLHTRAERLFAAIGMPSGSIADRYAQLWRDERWLYPADAAGQAQAIADMNRLLARLSPRLPSRFGPIPSWCLNVTARPLSAADIAAGRSGYRDVPTPRRPGAYIVDLREIRRRPRWTLPSVVAHELLPGHMLQLGLEGQAAPHPLRIDYASAFVEGWGIYAEQRAGLDGAFTDARDELGHIHWLIFRVARALIDLGIHLEGWSIGQARHQWIEWQGEPAYFAPFDTELARIPLEPASRVAEYLAWLAIADSLRNVGPGDLAGRHHGLLRTGRRRTEAMFDD